METPVTEADNIFFKQFNGGTSNPKWVVDRINSIKEKYLRFGVLVKRDVLREIGYFFCCKNNFDKKLAEIDLLQIGIHNIIFNEGTLFIVCERPGYLIGPNGQIISDLSICLNSWFKDYFEKWGVPSFEIPIDVKEAIINPYLFSFMEN